MGEILQQARYGASAVGDGVFGGRCHLGEGDVVAFGTEYRIVAEAVVAVA